VALVVARSDDPEAAMKEGAYAVDALLQRLLGWPPRRERR
jgi:hypothetical protein